MSIPTLGSPRSAFFIADPSLQPDGAASAFASGAFTVTNVPAGNIGPTGAASVFAAGTFTLTSGPTQLTPDGAASAFASGAFALVGGSVVIGMTGGQTYERSGVFEITQREIPRLGILYPVSALRTDGFGSFRIVAGPKDITPTGLPSAFAAGTITLTQPAAPFPQTITPTGAASRFGAGRFTLTGGGCCTDWTLLEEGCSDA